jgi:hypothetical protein
LYANLSESRLTHPMGLSPSCLCVLPPGRSSLAARLSVSRRWLVHLSLPCHPSLAAGSSVFCRRVVRFLPPGRPSLAVGSTVFVVSERRARFKGPDIFVESHSCSVT